MDESRIINGMFRTRYFTEGILMALIAGVPAALMPWGSFNLRIMAVVLTAAPAFFLGNSGINDETVSSFLKNAGRWRKTRGVMLYNGKIRPLRQSPLEAMMSRPQPGDRIMDMVDSMREARVRKSEEVQYIEGETFVFADDPELEGLYAGEGDEKQESGDKEQENIEQYK